MNAAPWIQALRAPQHPRASIVFVAGLAGLTDDWRAVVDLLPDDYAVLAIEPSRNPDHPTLPRRARMLAAAAANLTEPVIWVAHSMAVFAVETVAVARLAPIDGLVLVDPSSLDEAPNALDNSDTGDLLIGGRALAHWLHRNRHTAHKGTRIIGPLLRRLLVRGLTRRPDPATSEEVMSMYADPTTLATVLHELDHFSAQARTWDRLWRRLSWPEIPRHTLLAQRRRYAYESGPNEVVQVVPGTGHLIMLERPDVIVAAIGQCLPPAFRTGHSAVLQPGRMTSAEGLAG